MELARRAFVLWIVAALPSLAHQAIERGDFDLAVNCLDTYLYFNPDDPRIHVMLGWAHFKQGDQSAAIDAYSAAIRLDPKIALALHQRAELYFESKQYGRVAADYEAILRLEPENASVRLSLVDLLATCPDADVRNVARADALAGCLDPHAIGSYRAYVMLAAAHARRGDMERAIAWQRKALACADRLDKEEKRRTALVLKLYRTRKKQADKASSRRDKTRGGPQQDGGQ